MRHRALAVLPALFLVGCSHGSQKPHEAGDVDLLAGCGPLNLSSYAVITAAADIRRTSAGGPDTSAICSWEGATSGGPVEVTYGWMPDDTLMHEADIATRTGYTIEHVVIKRYGGIAWHDPANPGTCAISAFDSGTVTFWVANQNHSPTPDPCTAALALTAAVLAADGY
jgi:hypothetical protein